VRGGPGRTPGQPYSPMIRLISNTALTLLLHSFTSRSVRHCLPRIPRPIADICLLLHRATFSIYAWSSTSTSRLQRLVMEGIFFPALLPSSLGGFPFFLAHLHLVLACTQARLQFRSLHDQYCTPWRRHNGRKRTFLPW